ncbi:hypothetical protein PDIG_60680 [Penicillium digitatum PHI26]|uniref:Uncharacterized protein n=2 Tax=Penicillium digitatum TaxID=36651 RepID=K9FK65_PEND2|nr:hypothetical protein PDIP_70110 [Penicillium digitatum Pd1]EKV08048.1 hypothetical protein PDIP_70110 [Penicillium digitatum Pd1]EKV09644.1 hypothetical protein PDIG_60680 [Penicillium digitatum PHI26]
MGRGLGGQLPRRVSGGICGVAAGHSESEEQAGGFEVQVSRGEREEKQQRGKESGEEENACEEKGNWVPLRDVIALF